MLQSKHSLEKHRLFPYIAWGLCIMFAYFVYTLTIDLKNATASLEQQTARVEVRANQNVSEITDFER